MKTLKEAVNEVMDLATIFLKRNDHENYRRCVELIAEMMYQAYEENTLEIVEK